MPRRRRSGWIWGGRIAAVTVLAGLGAYLSSVGLEKADKLASVLVLLVAGATLVAPYLLPPSDGDHSEPRLAQHVANTVVGGHLTQIRNVGTGRPQGPVISGSRRAAIPAAGQPPESQSSQCVNGVWVGGNLIDDADGDVTIR
jgi:hypothetical protein